MEMSTPTLIQDVKKRSGWSIFMGIITALLGVFLIAYPMATATITTLVLGWTLILAGIAQFVFALHSQTPGNFFLRLLGGVIYAIAGIALAVFPIEGAAALTVFLGGLLLVQSVLAAVTAFQVKPAEGWGWYLFDAFASLALGVFILAKWPSSTFWAIGTMVGVAVFMGGIARTAIAAKLRSGAGDVDRAIHGTA
jgi:uncharacterized membrane protein HdeD (DUF308 family)